MSLSMTALFLPDGDAKAFLTWIGFTAAMLSMGTALTTMALVSANLH